MYSYAIRQIHLLVAVLGHVHLVGSSAAPCTMINLSRPEGTSVTLTMEYNSTAAENISAVAWWNNELIMRYYPGKLEVQPIYKDRVQFDNNTFSLELMNLQKKDSGVYHGNIIEKEKGTICAAKYNLSVVEPVAAPTLTVVSNWSSSDCNVTVTCRGHNLSLTFSCNRSDCTQLQDLLVTPTLAVFARDGYIICNYSNQVSWRSDMLDMSPYCEFAKGKHTSLWIPLTIGLMFLIVAVCALIVCQKRKQRSTGTNGNCYGLVQSDATPGLQI